MTGIKVERPASFGEVELGRRLAEQQPLPDFVVWATPGSLADREPDMLIDVSTYLDVEQLRDDFGRTLLSLGTVADDGAWPAENGAIVGLPIDLDVKGLVYYPKDDFDAAGYDVPETYDELIALSEQIVANGNTPWCFGFASAGEDNGWPGTDLVETLVLQQGGTGVYDAWTRHDIPFDAPEIRVAAARAEDLLLTDDFVRFGPASISLTPYFDGMAQMTAEEPGCWLYHQGDFALGGLPPNATPGIDIDVFAFPPLEPDSPTAVTGGGALLSTLADRPETRRFARYATAPTWGEEWAAPTRSNFISPNVRFDPAAYGRDGDPTVAAFRRAMGELALTSIANDRYRFDASDLMPGPIGSFDDDLRRGEFWQGMLDVVDGVRTMDEVLGDIEAAWVELESG